MYWQPKPWHSISQFCLFCVLMAILGGTNFEGILPTTHCSLPELMDGAHRNRDGKWKVDVKPIPFLSWSKPPFNLCHNTCKRLLFYMVVLSFSVFRWGSRGCEIPCSCHCFYQIAHRTQRLEWLVRELPCFLLTLPPATKKSCSCPGETYDPTFQNHPSPHAAILKYSCSLTKYHYVKITYVDSIVLSFIDFYQAPFPGF